MSNRRAQFGFTLIELVITMVISSIVIGFVSVFISGPVTGFTDQARRVKLLDAAESSLSRMSRDIRRALPNSVRITTAGANQVLELLSSVDGARYRRQPPGNANQILDFAAADTSFNTIGSFTQIAKPFSSTVHFLVIYNVGVPGANAYQLANVITPPGTQIDISVDVAGEDRVQMSPAFQFIYQSPRQRLFLVDTAISYLCDPVAGTLNRYSGYDIAADQSDRDSPGELIAAGAVAALMADDVGGCSFTYLPGTAERAGLVTLSLAVADSGESISMLRQVHVDNVP